MRTKHYHEALHHDSDRLVAYFGNARLVRIQAGRLEVRDRDRSRSRRRAGVGPAVPDAADSTALRTA